MRFHIHRNVAAASAGVALLAIASSARAQLQLDTNPPAPNVLLLLDNSGSMERMIDGALPEADGNACNYDMNGQAIPTAVAPQPNRWGNVLQALTGTFENSTYSCIQMPRTSGEQFAKEYQINGVEAVRRGLLPRLPPSGPPRLVDHAAHGVRHRARLAPRRRAGHGRRADRSRVGQQRARRRAGRHRLPVRRDHPAPVHADDRHLEPDHRRLQPVSRTSSTRPTSTRTAPSRRRRR